jgi:1-pyrroline-5-carboxylate dehydrogenase
LPHNRALVDQILGEDRDPQTAEDLAVYLSGGGIAFLIEWRDRLVAACMLELSKTSYQADGDAAAETVDFIRANLVNAVALASVQPSAPRGVSNHIDYRPLEGFVSRSLPSTSSR